MSIRKYQSFKPQLGNRIYVDPMAAIIGNVSMGDDCSVWPMAVIRGDMHRITIGTRCSIQDGAVLHITHAGPYHPDGFPLSLGNEVTVGHKAMLHGCSIGDRNLIGMGAIVMDGAALESDIILAAGSLVPPGKKLQSGYLYQGSPARAIRPLTDKELAYFAYTANRYVELKDSYLDDPGHSNPEFGVSEFQESPD